MFISQSLIFITSDFNLFSNKSPDSWSVILFSIIIIIYIILDNADGKQARKTNNSSPLGLIFDHGCDSVNACLSTWALVKLMGLTNKYYIIVAMISTTYGFHICTLEEYYTGSWDMGLFNAVNEGLVGTVFVILSVGIFSNNFLNEKILYFSLKEIVIIVFVISSAIIVFLSLKNIKNYISFKKMFIDLLTVHFTIITFILLVILNEYKNSFLIIICLNFSIIISRLTIMIQLSHISNEELRQNYIFPWIFNILLLISTIFLYDQFYFYIFIYLINICLVIYFYKFILDALKILSNILKIHIFKVKNFKGYNI